ncbi:hypothetical protein BD293_3918 [Roseinatronobacter monicus]|uniref:Uncharacterized protein n=1 Tax=Roseinatronobacter monicus TaxID=393481 RepID=A0A543K633_9RHOB|nr:hypothetical protein BD293_3918 [Roseinatronobacter monicus]
MARRAALGEALCFSDRRLWAGHDDPRVAFTTGGKRTDGSAELRLQHLMKAAGRGGTGLQRRARGWVSKL